MYTQSELFFITDTIQVRFVCCTQLAAGTRTTQSNTLQSAVVLNRRRYTAQRNRETQLIQIFSALVLNWRRKTAQHNRLVNSTGGEKPRNTIG
jgi:hypothetical protein